MLAHITADENWCILHTTVPLRCQKGVGFYLSRSSREKNTLEVVRVKIYLFLRFRFEDMLTNFAK
jgi:hypothetical protein